MKQKIIGVGYVRVSSQAQVREGVSLEVQEESVERLLRQLGATVIQMFREEGKSALTMEKRFEFQKAIKYSKEVGASYFAVYDVSRFARNSQDAFTAKADLEEHGVKLKLVTMDFQNSPEGFLAFGMQALFAEYQSKSQGAKISRSQQHKISMGLLMGPAPHGYENYRLPDGKAWVVPSETWAPIFRLGFEQYATGLIPTQVDLMNYFDREGYRRSYKGKMKSMSKQTIGKILRNPFYCGYTKVVNNQLIKPHPYEPLIAPETFLSIQAYLRANYKRNQVNKVLNEDFPLKSFSACLVCGKPMQGYTNKRGKSKVYDCRTKGCGNSRQYYHLESSFKSRLGRVALKQSRVDAFLEVFGRIHRLSKVHVRGRIKLLQSQLNELMLVQDSIVMAIPQLPQETVRERYTLRVSELEKEIKQIKIQLHDKKLELDCEPPTKEVVDILAKPLETWLEMSLTSKMNFQKWIFPAGISYHPKQGLRTNMINPIFEVVKETSNVVNVNDLESSFKWSRGESNP